MARVKRKADEEKQEAIRGAFWSACGRAGFEVDMERAWAKALTWAAWGRYVARRARYLSAVIAVIVVAGCSGSVSSERLIGVRSYPFRAVSGGVETVTVRVVESERTRPYCGLDVTGVDCEFPSAYLMDFAAIERGGWRSITFDGARSVCAEAMFYVSGSVTEDLLTQCAWALVELRWREAMPVEPDRNQ